MTRRRIVYMARVRNAINRILWHLPRWVQNAIKREWGVQLVQSENPRTGRVRYRWMTDQQYQRIQAWRTHGKT